MADSETAAVDVNDDLDAFSNQFFGIKGDEPEKEEAVKDDEASEIETPSATKGNESHEDEPEGEPEDQEDAPATDEDEEVEDEEEDKSLLKVKPRKTARERINELTRQAREAERRADALARELETARVSRSEPEKTPVQDVKPADSNAPTPDDLREDGTPVYPMGEFDPLFIRDLTRYTISQETAAIREQENKERQAREAELADKALTEAWTEKLGDIDTRIPDFREKVVDLEDTFRDIPADYGKYLAATIMSLDHGPDVLNYLADNPAEARKIVASGATQATIALGRIEGRFAYASERDKVEKGTVVTSAPPPPTARTRGSSGRHVVSPDTDDLDAFEKQFFAKKR